MSWSSRATSPMWCASTRSGRPRRGSRAMGPKSAKSGVFAGDAAVTARSGHHAQALARVLMTYLATQSRPADARPRRFGHAQSLTELRKRLEQANLKVDNWISRKTCPATPNSPERRLPPCC